MKKIITFVSTVLLLSGISAVASAQPVQWTGPAAAGSYSFSMAAWLYGGMAEIGSLLYGPSPGYSVTSPNTLSGYNVNYTGDIPGQIICHSEYLGQPNGFWSCQIASDSLDNGLLARGLVNHLLRFKPTFYLPNGTATLTQSTNQIQIVVKYNDGRIQGIGCGYTMQNYQVSWAECSFK